jgi:hypothetical protein
VEEVRWEQAASGLAWHYDLWQGDVCFACDITQRGQAAKKAIERWQTKGKKYKGGKNHVEAAREANSRTAEKHGLDEVSVLETIAWASLGPKEFDYMDFTDLCRLFKVAKQEELRHRERHVELHKHLDELLADFLGSTNCQHLPTETPLMTLMEWSFKQSNSPTEEG